MEATSRSLQEALERHRNQGVNPIELTAETIPRLEEYCRLLWTWNEKMNLTRHLDFDTFVARDLVDTVQLSQLLLEGEEVLDFGSGGGVPGITLALIRPDLDMSLSESVVKKSKALESMVADLALPIRVFPERAEKVLEDFRFDALTARAVGPLWKICTWFAPHWLSIGRLLAIKGPNWPQERGEARHRGLMHNVMLRCVSRYPMSGTDSESVILQLWQKGQTPAGPPLSENDLPDAAS